VFGGCKEKIKEKRLKEKRKRQEEEHFRWTHFPLSPVSYLCSPFWFISSFKAHGLYIYIYIYIYEREERKNKEKVEKEIGLNDHSLSMGVFYKIFQ
jgi:hypothetical protein